MGARLTLSIARTRAQVNTQFSPRPYFAESKPLRLICLGDTRCPARTTIRRERVAARFLSLGIFQESWGLPRNHTCTDWREEYTNNTTSETVSVPGKVTVSRIRLV